MSSSSSLNNERLYLTIFMNKTVKFEYFKDKNVGNFWSALITKLQLLGFGIVGFAHLEFEILGISSKIPSFEERCVVPGF